MRLKLSATNVLLTIIALALILIVLVDLGVIDRNAFKEQPVKYDRSRKSLLRR